MSVRQDEVRAVCDQPVTFTTDRTLGRSLPLQRCPYGIQSVPAASGMSSQAEWQRRERKWRMGPLEIEVALPPREDPSRWLCSLNMAIVRRRGWLDGSAEATTPRSVPSYKHAVQKVVNFEPFTESELADILAIPGVKIRRGAAVRGGTIVQAIERRFIPSIRPERKVG